jgi:hypothetical protein
MVCDDDMTGGCCWLKKDNGLEEERSWAVK